SLSLHQRRAAHNSFGNHGRRVRNGGREWRHDPGRGTGVRPGESFRRREAELNSDRQGADNLLRAKKNSVVGGISAPLRSLFIRQFWNNPPLWRVRWGERREMKLFYLLPLTLLPLALAPLQAAVDPTLLGLVMPDAVAVAGVQVEQGQASPFGRFLLSHA